MNPDGGFDDEARREIRERLDENFIVEAGAGTGKTSALIDRVLALVLGGRKIDRLVAITFTDKAAAELRDRVRRGLEAVMSAGDLDQESAARVQEALESLDRAHISTIHAFCQSLLQQFAPELSVDPAYEVHDEVLAERRFEERWRLHLERMGLDEAAKRTVDRALDLGLSTGDIANLGASLWHQPELAPLLQKAPLVAGSPLWPDLERLAGSLEALPLTQVPAGDRLRIAIEALVASINGLRRREEDRDAYLTSVVASLPRGFGVGRWQNWGNQVAIERARSIAQSVADELRALLAGLRSEALAALLPYVVEFVMVDAVVRGREGKLVFDDLILRVRELLRDRPGARLAVRERFDCMLIDEFQDTDPLQVEVAMAFARDPASGELESGRLFLVGDPKQSIYRFRRADMAVYSATREGMVAGGALLAGLKQNRRSRSQIVEWVNAVFGALIGAGEEPEFQPPYREIEAVRASRLRGPGLAWFGGPLDLVARDVRRQEATAVARQVRAAVESGWEVENRATLNVRSARFSDIAVLVPTRAILLPLERALQDCGVPYRVEGGSLVYATQEVRDIVNCLTAIDDPADEVAVVAALRSPAYACSDVELAAFRLDGGRFDYLADLEGREGKVPEALRSLRAFHQSRYHCSLASLVERFLADRGLVESGILDQGNRNPLRRARFLIEQARAFEAGGPESLRAFVGWLERRASGAILDNEGAGLDDDEDAVRVLTVHGAKGLEFPIVFAAGLGWTPGTDRHVFGMDRSTQEIAVSVGAMSRGGVFTLGPVDKVNNQESRHLKAERDRLLYVAATRARDHLVLSLYHKQGAGESAAARLIVAGACEGALELAEAPVPDEVASSSLATIAVDRVISPEEFEGERQRLVASARLRTYTSATALGPQWKTEASDQTEPWTRGRGSTRIGRAVHAAIQSVGWDAGDEEIEAVAQAQAVAEAVPGRAAEVAGLVRRALATPAATRARVATRALREVPFGVRLDGGVFVEGFIDAVIDSGEGLEVIDWKTDDVSADEAPKRLAEYELQAGLYALALETATARPISRLTYVFVRPGLELSPGDPRELAARAREVVLPGL